MDLALRAVIYLTCLAPRCLERCHAHICRRGYRTVGVIHDPRHERWLDVLAAAIRGEYEVVVRCCDDLPPDRVPRVEIADRTPVVSITSRRRRPRVA